MSASLHLYAVLDRPAVERPERGAFGEPLVEVEAASLVAVAGALDSVPPGDEPSAALAHAGLVETLAERAPAVLPSRFGVRFAGADALRAAVEANAGGLASALEAVRGCVEIAVTAVFPPADASPPRSGREYLERRRGEARMVEALVRDVNEPLERRSRDVRVAHGIAPPRFSASYLVARDDVDAFSEEAERLGGAAEVTLVRSGPWPAYTFATPGEES